jgi:plasmid maintenance system antidote protein VapI
MHTMSKGRPSEPITGLLRQTIREAIEGGQVSYSALERATSISRASIARFVRGTQTLRIDLADRLADYFGLELRIKGKDS